MPFKDPEKKRAYQKVASKKHYEKNKQEYIDRAAVRKSIQRQTWESFKKTLSCVWCGYNKHPVCLDHHHVIRTDHKKVHRLIANGQIEKAFEEIKKCVVLCSNCHRYAHWLEKNGTDKEVHEMQQYFASFVVQNRQQT